jgi:sarcosine oxidase, subunit gamma
MITPHRLSAIHVPLQQLDGSWGEINGMPTLLQTAHDTKTAQILGIADLSSLIRFGVKGAGAAAWLADYGIAIERPNCWIPLANGGLALRLGVSEYLIETGLSDSANPFDSIASRLVDHSYPAQVYPVLRQDLALALCGEQVSALMLQTCNINFRALDLSKNPVVLTTMIGVAVTILPSERHGLPFYRVWCDGTFGNYFWHTLLEIAQALGGGAVGLHSVLIP